MTTINGKWWLTADGSRAVPDGDPEAAVLFATPGDEVADEDAVRLGILEPEPKRRKGGSKQKVTAEDAAIGTVEEAAEEA